MDEYLNDFEEQNQAGLRKTKVFGAVLIPASFVGAYFWIVQPVRQAAQTGVLDYSLRGVLLPPALLYLGVALLLSDLRDGQIRSPDAEGKPRLTAKGRKFMVGIVAVLGVSLVAWYCYLRSIGFKMF